MFRCSKVNFNCKFFFSPSLSIVRAVMEDEDESKEFLYDQVRILCMVFTVEYNFKSKAKLVNETWGKRCNKLLFLANTTGELIFN